MTQVPKAQLNLNLKVDDSCSNYDELSSQDTFRTTDETVPDSPESHPMCLFVAQQQAKVVACSCKSVFSALVSAAGISQHWDQPSELSGCKDATILTLPAQQSSEEAAHW